MPSIMQEGDTLRWVKRRRGASWEVCVVTRAGRIWFMASDVDWQVSDVSQKGGELGEDVVIPVAYADNLWGGVEADPPS